MNDFQNRALLVADMEGITGIYRQRQVHTGTEMWRNALPQYREDVLASARGFLAAGARKVLVRDTHDTMQNLRGRSMHPDIQLLAGFRSGPPTAWGPIPTSRVAGLIGAHVAASSSVGFFPHTLWAVYNRVELDGSAVAEVDLLIRLLSTQQIPVGMISGDIHILEWTAERYPWIEGVPIEKSESPNTDSKRKQLFENQRNRLQETAQNSWDRASTLPLVQHQGNATLKLTCKSSSLAKRVALSWKIPRDGNTLVLEAENFTEAFEAFFRVTFFNPYTYRLRRPLLALLTNFHRFRHRLW